MDENNLMAFIKWLPTKIEAFQNKTPEEIAQILNTMSKTEEGKAEIEELIGEFKEFNSTEMFKKGGKLAYLVDKFKNGGEAKKDKKIIKEGKKSDKFNRTSYRNMKAALRDQDLGLNRREIKVAAMNNILGSPTKVVKKEEYNSIAANPFTPFNSSIKREVLPKINIEQTPDLTGTSFSKAFAAARKGGLSKFIWNGKLYGTELATSRKSSTLPTLPKMQLPKSSIDPEKEAMDAAKGLRPSNMNEEDIINNNSYSDYIFMSNLGNPNRFDSRYVGPRDLVFTGNSKVTYGYVPMEYRGRPWQFSSFKNGGILKIKNNLEELEEKFDSYFKKN